jgi:hypothetical protein
MSRFLNQLIIGELGLRILVQELHVRVSRGRVEVIVQFLDVFPVIPLTAGETEQPFLDDLVLAVPKPERET